MCWSKYHYMYYIIVEGNIEAQVTVHSIYCIKNGFDEKVHLYNIVL